MNDLEDRYLSLNELSLYSGLSISMLKRRLRGSNGFPHIKTGHRVLVKKSEFDLWMEKYRTTASETPPDKIQPDKIQDITYRILEELEQYKKAA